MIGAPLAHMGGIPIEETIGPFGPALLAALGVAYANLRARLRPVAGPSDASRAERPRPRENAHGSVERRGTRSDEEADAWL
jgi:hypothetical protein